MSRARKALIICVGVVLAALIVVFAAAWYFAGVIEEEALVVRHERDPFDLRVAAIDGGRITLETTAETTRGRWDEPGIWGLESADTYNRVGRIVDAGDGSVVRELIALGPLPAVGAPVRIDRDSFPGDPLAAHGIEFREVGVPAALGTFPAWLTFGESDTWVILVHGMGAERTELLRTLPAFVENGHPTLTITYRNDEGLPAGPSGYYQFGADEWEDLEAAAEFTLAAGARHLVLVGYSMGGAITLSFLYHSPIASRVKGVVLDSPALDFEANVDAQAARQRPAGVPLPGALTALAKSLAALRFGIDYRAMNYLERAEALSAPVLLFHGSADSRVPISLSDRLAAARPDIVEYLVFDGAVHVASWNLDPQRYESAVRGFLARID